MKRISSRSTSFHKRIFPVMCFGFLAVVFLISLVAFMAKGQVPVPFLLMPIAMAIFGYILMKVLVFDLMDEVWDEGNTLLVRDKGKDERIDLKNIKNISFL